jgi:P-type Cu+ transporter
MKPSVWLVVLAGVPAVRATAEKADDGATPSIQVANITVKGGYDPANIRVRHGVPVRMIFDRQETDSCSEELVFPAFGIRRALPAFRKTAIDFTPAQAGVYPFTCGMSMLHGSVTAE